MPFGPTEVVAWAGGYDLANAGSLMTFEEEVSGLTVERSLLGPPGTYEHYVAVGVRSLSITESGWLDDGGLDLRQVLGAPSGGHLLVHGFEGADQGGSCRIATAMQVRNHRIEAEVKGLTRISEEWYQGNGGVVHEGILIAGGQRVTAAQSSVVWYDNDEPKTDGLRVALMAADIEWDSATQLDISIRHSATDSGTGSAYGGNARRLRITPGTDTVRGSLWASATVAANQYLGVGWAWSGGDGAQSAKILAAVVNR